MTCESKAKYPTPLTRRTGRRIFDLGPEVVTIFDLGPEVLPIFDLGQGVVTIFDNYF